MTTIEPFAPEPTALQVAQAAAEDAHALRLRLRVEALEAYLLRRTAELIPQRAIDEAIATEPAEPATPEEEPA